MAKGGVIGLDKHLKRLQRMGGPALERAVGAALYAGGDEIASEAKRSITAGSVSGKGHVPSSPGQPPNNDTGNLKDQIVVTKVSNTVVEVSSEAEYAAIQEFGGTIRHPGGTPFFMRDGKPVFVSNKGQGAFHNLPKTKPHDIILPARPYMRPARDAKKEEVVKIVQTALDALNKKSGGA